MATDVEVKKVDRPFARLRDWFEPPELFHFFEGIRPFEDRMRLEEEVVGDHLVFRAEIPGVDPEKDVELVVEDGMLTMRAERRKEETTTTEGGGYRSEFRYGSFQRTMALPKGATAKDVTATYKDGILEVKVPMPKADANVEKVAVTRA